MSMSLHIDWTACDGRGLCAELLPRVLDRDDWGYPVARGRSGRERTDVPLQEQDLAAAEEAVVLCPRLALGLHARAGEGHPGRGH